MKMGHVFVYVNRIGLEEKGRFRSNRLRRRLFQVQSQKQGGALKEEGGKGLCVCVWLQHWGKRGASKIPDVEWRGEF